MMVEAVMHARRLGFKHPLVEELHVDATALIDAKERKNKQEALEKLLERSSAVALSKPKSLKLCCSWTGPFRGR